MAQGDAAPDEPVAAAERDGSPDPDERPENSPIEYASLLEALDAGVFVLDPEGTCTFVDDELCALTGYDREEILGAGPGLVVDDATADELERRVISGLKASPESFTIGRRLAVQRADGDEMFCQVRMTVLRDDDGAVRASVGIVRSLTRQERREDLLSRLQETTQSLMQAPDRETVAEIVADAAVDRLGFSACVVRLYDADERTLEPVARADDSGEGADPLPTLGLEAGPAADVFTSGEPAVYDDIAAIDAATVGDRGAPVLEAGGACAAIYHPIGVHGTVALGIGRPGAVDDVDRQIAGLLATNGAAACNRAKRERQVRDAREHVATIVDRIEGLVEDTIEVLVGATTRENVERGVCERLAATDPYACAWLARPDVRESALVHAEHAGTEATGADRRIDLDTDDPTATAYRTGTSQVVDGTALAEATDGWPAAAHDRGVAAAVAIPLAHRQDSFGVLVVCSDDEAVFEQRELVVLEALGRAVANAIDAIESGRILETDEVVELTIEVEGGTLLDRVASGTGASLVTAGSMSAGDGSLRLFLTATGGDPAEVESALAADDAVTACSLVADLGEECLFDCTLQGSLVADLVDRGAVPKGVGTDGQGTRLTIEVPDDRAARETFAFVEDRTVGATLAGYREHERPVRTRQEFRASLAERFTDRQETALRTAYHGGFFDWPRGADGDDLAESMGISRPTYHQHLRTAQRKVFEELFEADAARGE